MSEEEFIHKRVYFNRFDKYLINDGSLQASKCENFFPTNASTFILTG